ncbi:MAG: PD40 domain-containing protein [Acidobacteria bacterium]|nr:PD40 domain-containing protein [Acidobacteriota bacterium]
MTAQGHDEKRLDSWKQIAAYLGKSERTVRRWEQTEGLPVHKHQHLQKGSVWAFAGELDEWRCSRSPERPGLVELPTNRTSDRIAWRWILLATAGATAVAATVAWFGVRTWPSDEFVSQPLTVLQGSEYSPSFSPDGNRVAFFWNNPGAAKPGIYTHGMNTELPVPLAISQDNFQYSPAWSPDGRSIAFLRRTLSHSTFAGETWLMLVPSGGGPAQSLIQLASGFAFMANNSHLSWTPDGRAILAPMVDGEHRGIYRIPMDGAHANVSRLTNPVKGVDIGPALSRDGRSFIFLRRNGPIEAAVESIYRQELTANGFPDGPPRLLYHDRGMLSGVVWLPSGKDLALCRGGYLPDSSNGLGLFRISAEIRRSPVLLKSGPCHTIAISPPDTSGRTTLVYGTHQGFAARLWHARLQSLQDHTPFAPASSFDSFPSYSPDGRLVAYASAMDGKSIVRLVRADGSEPRKIWQGPSLSGGPRWSPDGKQIVIGLADPIHGGLFLLPVSGGNPAPLNIGGQPAGQPFWSPGGKEIIYWSGTELWRTSMDGRDRSSLGPSLRLGAQDSRFTYFVKTGDLIRVPVSGGKEEKIAENLASNFIAATQKFVYFVRAGDRMLCAIPVAGGATRELGVLPELEGKRFLQGLSVSPDDSSILWAAAGNREDEIDLHVIRDFR